MISEGVKQSRFEQNSFRIVGNTTRTTALTARIRSVRLLLESDADTAAAAAPATAKSNTSEYTPPRTGGPRLVIPPAIPSVKMFHVQRGKSVIGLIHFLNRRTRDLPDKGHSCALYDGRRIKEFFVQGQEPPLRLQTISLRLLIVV